MKRKVIDRLIEWKQESQGKPVLLTGAKGVGKTYVVYDFAKSFFKQILYINLEYESLLRERLSDTDAGAIPALFLEHLKLADENNTFDPSDRSRSPRRILIIDEISYCPELVKHLDCLRSSGEFPRIIAITSTPLPEEANLQFQILPVYPLEFDEFLLATANDWYIESITTHYESNKPLPEIVHQELLALHELYMNLGGMPGAVNEYLNFNSLINIKEQHCRLTGAYHDDILQNNPDSTALKMNQVIDSLPSQLMKPNKKFQYTLIRKGTTHSMYKDAIEKLKNCNYLLQCHKTLSASADPSGSATEVSLNIDETTFKLYLPDVGLLCTQLSKEKYEPANPILRKALLENYVAQAFHAKSYPLVYWESESMAKIEFILNKREYILPIEVHIDGNTRSKSISVLKQKWDFPYAVKISSKNFDYINQVKYVPYYAVFCI